jgi:hypothetical protein
MDKNEEKIQSNWVWWHMSVISATHEVEEKGSQV